MGVAILVDHIKQAITESVFSLNVENMNLPVGAEELVLRQLHGEISHEEFIRHAEELAKS